MILTLFFIYYIHFFSRNFLDVWMSIWIRTCESTASGEKWFNRFVSPVWNRLKLLTLYTLCSFCFVLTTIYVTTVRMGISWLLRAIKLQVLKGCEKNQAHEIRVWKNGAWPLKIILDMSVGNVSVIYLKWMMNWTKILYYNIVRKPVFCKIFKHALIFEDNEIDHQTSDLQKW